MLLSSEILTEKFCCDLSVCKGECCVEGDAGAPVTMEEIAEIEECVDTVWEDLSASAQAVIDKQGVAYTDKEGDLVTSIVGGKDCVFTYYGDIEDCNTHLPIKNCCLCALEKAYRAGKSRFYKPISCALYPIREKKLGDGLVGCLDVGATVRNLALQFLNFALNLLDAGRQALDFVLKILHL